MICLNHHPSIMTWRFTYYERVLAYVRSANLDNPNLREFVSRRFGGSAEQDE